MVNTSVLIKTPDMIWAGGHREFNFISQEIVIHKTELQDLPESTRARGGE